jgi:uncharacterized membrane protein
MGIAARRVMVVGVLAVIVAAVSLLLDMSWSVSLLLGWDAAALVYMAWIWATVRHSDEAETARKALREDSSRTAAEAVLLSAGTASLLAVAFTLAQAGRADSPQRGFLTVFAIVSVALGWLSLHTVFLLRYARLYYSEPEGGIDFSGEKPDYRDFAYLALTIGMTFQTSDTSITTKRVRRTALEHSLLSYLFGTVIVAVTVNSVAGLLGP